VCEVKKKKDFTLKRPHPKKLIKAITCLVPRKAVQGALQSFFIVPFAFYKIGIPRLNDQSFRRWLIVPQNLRKSVSAIRLSNEALITLWLSFSISGSQGFGGFGFYLL
jgi:hypothetical protein